MQVSLCFGYSKLRLAIAQLTLASTCKSQFAKFDLKLFFRDNYPRDHFFLSLRFVIALELWIRERTMAFGTCSACLPHTAIVIYTGKPICLCTVEHLPHPRWCLPLRKVLFFVKLYIRVSQGD